MEQFILIDNELLCFLKATPSIEQAEYWAEILAPTHDFLVTGTANRDFSSYTKLELRMLYYNSTGINAPDDIDYGKILKGVADIARQLTIDETPVEALKEKLGRELSPPAPEPAPEPKTPKPSGVKISGRPKDGSTSAKIWGIADALKEEKPDYNSADFRAQVVAKCKELGINGSTANTQFGKWKKFVSYGQ